VIDRVIAGMCASLIRPARLFRSAIVRNPSPLMNPHRSLVRRKYQWLFTPKTEKKPGPKGPSAELVAAIIELKHRNPNFGCRRIAEQILTKHFHRNPSGGASWLTLLGHSEDSVWRLDLFRCEFQFLQSHWVMVVMDQYSRRIIGFAGMLEFWTAPPFAGCSVKPTAELRHHRVR
jgi:putative transposase